MSATRVASIWSMALAVLCPIAFGAAAASAEAISACINPAGLVRIVDASVRCRSNEKAIELSSPPSDSGIANAVHGSVDGDGTILFDSSGFSVERGSAGNYHIVFDTAFDGTPTCTVTSYSASTPCSLNVFGTPGIFKTPEEFRVLCTQAAAGGGATATDSSFDFICVE